MKNKNNIRALTGMSQENLALLLQVSRSQIAMFESGKRNLPIQAMEKLALLLTLSQKESTPPKPKKQLELKNKNSCKIVSLKTNINNF